MIFGSGCLLRDVCYERVTEIGSFLDLSNFGLFLDIKMEKEK